MCMRAPLTLSQNSIMSSRSSKPHSMGVMAPTSMAKAQSVKTWLRQRPISA